MSMLIIGVSLECSKFSKLCSLCLYSRTAAGGAHFGLSSSAENWLASVMQKLKYELERACHPSNHWTSMICVASILIWYLLFF